MLHAATSMVVYEPCRALQAMNDCGQNVCIEGATLTPRSCERLILGLLDCKLTRAELTGLMKDQSARKHDSLGSSPFHAFLGWKGRHGEDMHVSETSLGLCPLTWLLTSHLSSLTTCAW